MRWMGGLCRRSHILSLTFFESLHNFHEIVVEQMLYILYPFSSIYFGIDTLNTVSLFRYVYTLILDCSRAGGKFRKAVELVLIFCL